MLYVIHDIQKPFLVAWTSETRSSLQALGGLKIAAAVEYSDAVGF